MHGRKAKGYSGLTKLFYNYLCAARRRGFEFEFTREEFEVLTSSKCWYCGIPPSSKAIAGGCTTEEGKEHSTYLYNGIDRQRNDVGYTKENCVTACERCNRAKFIFTEESFLDWVKRIYENKYL